MFLKNNDLAIPMVGFDLQRRVPWKYCLPSVSRARLHEYTRHTPLPDVGESTPVEVRPVVVLSVNRGSTAATAKRPTDIFGAVHTDEPKRRGCLAGAPRPRVCRWLREAAELYIPRAVSRLLQVKYLSFINLDLQ